MALRRRVPRWLPGPLALLGTAESDYRVTGSAPTGRMAAWLISRGGPHADRRANPDVPLGKRPRNRGDPVSDLWCAQRHFRDRRSLHLAHARTWRVSGLGVRRPGG